MISYGPLWETMRKQEITTYTLIQKYNVNSRTVHNLKHDVGITMTTLEHLCKCLNCTPNDIVEFIDEDEKKQEK